MSDGNFQIKTKNFSIGISVKFIIGVAVLVGIILLFATGNAHPSDIIKFIEVLTKNVKL